MNKHLLIFFIKSPPLIDYPVLVSTGQTFFSGNRYCYTIIIIGIITYNQAICHLKDYESYQWKNY